MIGNLYSVAELEDLLAQKDQELAALENAFHAFDRAWRAWDTQADAAWMRDYNALKARYAAARARAAQAIALAESSPTLSRAGALGNNPLTMVFADLATAGQSPQVRDADLPADAEYRGVLAALQRQSGATTPGDFKDLWDRLQNAISAHAAATGAPPPAAIYDPPAIQPRKDDMDLLAYQRAKAATTVPGARPGKPWGTGKLLLLGAGLGAVGLGVAKVAGKIAWKTVWPF